MPQATRSDDHRTYRCYLRGPDGIRELSPCGPGAPLKLFLGAWEVNEDLANLETPSEDLPYGQPGLQASAT